MKPEYFDHVSEAELAKIAPYKGVDVTVPISTVLRSRNKGLYNTYNPKYSEVVPGRITTDPFYRYEQLLAALADIAVTFMRSSSLKAKPRLINRSMMSAGKRS